MSSKRKKPPTDEFTPADIQKKFDNIPVLTAMEKKVLKTSWKAIKRKMDKVTKSDRSYMLYCNVLRPAMTFNANVDGEKG